MSTTSFTKRATAVVGAAAIALLAVLGTAAPASAATNYDQSKNGTAALTIHKFDRTATNGTGIGTGQKLADESGLGNKLAGVEFTVSKVNNIDLNTNDGWTKAANLAKTPEAAKTAPYGLGTSSAKTTGTEGTAAFTNLPFGVYLVEETKRPESVIEKTASFIVTVPTATGSRATPNNSWIYDVHVYPKNAVTSLTKNYVKATAGSAEAQNADLFRWNVSATVPYLDTEASRKADALNKFIITDTIDLATTELVTSAVTGVTGTNVKVTHPSSTVPAFVLNTDYTLAQSSTTGVTTVTFTSAGLTKLQGLGGGTVTLDLLTRAKAATGGKLLNNATSTLGTKNSGDVTSKVVTAEAPVAALNIFAYVNDGSKTPLANTEFQVFPVIDGKTSTTPIIIKGSDKFTSDDKGLISVPGLVPGTYVVKETSAPAGYELPTLADGGKVEIVTQPAAGQNYVEAPHSQYQLTTLALPFTGGNGPLIFGLGGGALLALALGAALVVARRRSAEARVEA